MPRTGEKTAKKEKRPAPKGWPLVQFIRRLPHLMEEEREHMAELNPISGEAWLQRLEKEAFLRSGGDPRVELLKDYRPTGW